MYFPHDDKLGIFVQQDGFLDKDVSAVSQPSQQISGPLISTGHGITFSGHRIFKQADVLQASTTSWIGSHRKRRNAILISMNH
ncbi:Maltose phosphorylase [Lactiplantibacillus plantarum subsp. plantarum]|uniref:Maltose phosphorylase n=1 Tax=Lactiplantibacillus plantarum subsp. plantarum TaxID=337330 RepID=A0A2S3U8F4_LACPN|nr:Maltose phosphorylase [Lactiplantibacillus plantarum subsp. plantarum]